MQINTAVGSEKNAEANPAAEPAIQPLFFKIQLSQRDAGQLEARTIDTPLSGQSLAISPLPYTRDELPIVLKALENAVLGPIMFTEVERSILRALGLFQHNQTKQMVIERIGQQLYDLLFLNDKTGAFQSALHLARARQMPVSLQLRFDEHSVDLAHYPWELLHDGRRPLLASGAVELTRYITYPEAPTRLKLEAPLHLLYVAPRPNDLEPLPRKDAASRIPEFLQKLERAGNLTITELHTPTYDDLLVYLQSHHVHMLHFDGHGAFKQEGYLAFEDRTRDAHWIKSSVIANILYNRRIQLAVLMACSSSVVAGDTLFTGFGPALIQAGVPAVIATQMPISVEAAASFAEGLYRSIARKQSISTAVANGRQHLFLGQEWFVPVLYLRE